MIDRQTSDDGYYLDESNETTHRRATIDRDGRRRGLMEGGDGVDGVTETKEAERRSSQDIPVIRALIND